MSAVVHPHREEPEIVPFSEWNAGQYLFFVGLHPALGNMKVFGVGVDGGRQHAIGASIGRSGL
jgi:hypothetical protein